MKKKMGRPPTENPRNRKLNIRLTQKELDLIENCSKKLNKTRTDTILHGVNLIDLKEK